MAVPCREYLRHATQPTALLTMTTPLLRSLRSPSSDAATYKRKRPRKFAGWLGLAVLAAAALRNNSSLRTSVEAFVPGQKFVSSVPKRDSSSSSFSPVAASSASLALASAFYSDATTATSSTASWRPCPAGPISLRRSGFRKAIPLWCKANSKPCMTDFRTRPAPDPSYL